MSSTIFTGSSRYASDFQSVIDRAVAIASLPLSQMQSERGVLNSQSSAASSLKTKVDQVQSAISTLSASLGLNSYKSSVSDTSIVKASLAEGVLAGTYTVQVKELGAYTNTMGKNWADADPVTLQVKDASKENLTASSTYQLKILDGEGAVRTTYDIDLAGKNNLNALVEQINKQAGGDVQASVVNVGGSTPDYRISIQLKILSTDQIQLTDGTNDLLDQLTAGAPAQYIVNGSSTVATSDSRTVNIAPGLTVDLLKQQESTAAPVTITVSRDTNSVSNALSSFVNAYNAAVTELDLHRGQGNGVLKGHSIIATVADTLRSTASYSSGTGEISSLADLGLEFDDKGKLSLNSATFSANTKDQFEKMLAFFGSTAEGGFLQSAATAVNGLQSSDNSVLGLTISSLSNTLKSQDARIAAEQERIGNLETRLQAQMAEADALIAMLEQQVTYFTNMFESMRVASRGMS